jgi:hypothetical protein
MALSTRDTDAAFADMICADPQWLDAEFDALIAASFSQPPGSPPPAPPLLPPRPGTPASWFEPPQIGRTAAAFAAVETGHGRQRSPPGIFRPAAGPNPCRLSSGIRPPVSGTAVLDALI